VRSRSRVPPDRGGDVVLTTGAAGSIGSATVAAFLSEGFTVVGLDRDPAVESAAKGRYVGVAVDLCDERALEEAVSGVRSQGRLTHVIGIAGGALSEEPGLSDAALISPAIFRSSVEVNLTTQFLLLRAVLPWLRASRHDARSITFTSSWNALTGAGMPAYSAAKAGLIGLMHAVTPPLGAEGIRVNVVAPGTVFTARTARIWSGDTDHFSRLEQSTALGRLGAPEDVARAFVALATMLTHMTGQVLVVDGGQMIKRS
jgi:3-oxoacyl-[acyl-carrier protein] reductase